MATPDMPDFGYGYLGEQPKFKDFGLMILSVKPTRPRDPKEPKIYLAGNEVEIELGYKYPVKTMVSLKSAKDNEEKDDCVFTQTMESEKTIQIIATIPERGFWKLEIYALPASDSGNTLAGVFNYGIHCPRVNRKAYPYPKRYKQWSDGCYLYDPLILHKDVRGSTVHFKVRIPKAKDVAISINKQQPWTHLKDELGRGIWEGNVALAEHYGRNSTVTVNARFGGEKEGSYATLLEYSGV